MWIYGCLCYKVINHGKSHEYMNNKDLSVSVQTQYVHKSCGVNDVWRKPLFTTMRMSESKVLGANMGPIWGRQDPGGPYVSLMNFLSGMSLNRKTEKVWRLFQHRDVFARYEDFHYKLKLPWDHPDFLVEIHILIREHFHINTVAYIQCTL